MTEMETFDLEWVQYVVATDNYSLRRLTIETSKLIGNGIYKFKIREADKYFLASQVYNKHGLLVWQFLKVKTSADEHELPIERSDDPVYYQLRGSEPFSNLYVDVRWSPKLYMTNATNVTPQLPAFFQGLFKNFFGYHDESDYVKGANHAQVELRPCVPDYHATRLSSAQGRMMMDSEYRDIWVRSYSAEKFFHGSGVNILENNNWHPHFMRNFTLVHYGHNAVKARVISMMKDSNEPIGAKGRWTAGANLPPMEQGKTYPGYPSSEHFRWSQMPDRLAVYVDGDVFYYGGASSPLRGLPSVSYTFSTRDELNGLSVLLGVAGNFVPFMTAHPFGVKIEGFYYDFISWFTSDYTGGIDTSLMSGLFDTSDTLPGTARPRTDAVSARRNNFLSSIRYEFGSIWRSNNVKAFEYTMPSGRKIPMLMPQAKLLSISPVPRDGLWIGSLKNQGMLAKLRNLLPTENAIPYPRTAIRDSDMILPTMRLVSKSRDTVDENTARMTASLVANAPIMEHPYMKLLPEMERLGLGNDFVTGHPHDIFRVGESVSDGYMNIALPIYLMDRQGLSNITGVNRPYGRKHISFPTGVRGIYTYDANLQYGYDTSGINHAELIEKIKRAPLRVNKYDLVGQVGGLLMDVTANDSDIAIMYHQINRNLATADLYSRYIHPDSGRHYLGAMFTVTGSNNYIEIDLDDEDARAVMHGGMSPTAALTYEMALVSISGSNNIVNIVFRGSAKLSLVLKSIAGGMRTHLLDNRTGNNNQVWLTHADGKDVATRMRFGQNSRVDALPTLFGRI